MKISEYENKYKDAEARRQSLTFELEREKAKWMMEKDTIECSKREMQDLVERLEKKKD